MSPRNCNVGTSVTSSWDFCCSVWLSDPKRARRRTSARTSKEDRGNYFSFSAFPHEHKRLAWTENCFLLGILENYRSRQNTCFKKARGLVLGLCTNPGRELDIPVQSYVKARVPKVLFARSVFVLRFPKGSCMQVWTRPILLHRRYTFKPTLNVHGRLHSAVGPLIQRIHALDVYLTIFHMR